MGVGRILSYAGMMFILFLTLILFISPETFQTFAKPIFNSYIPFIVVFLIIYAKIISSIAKKMKESNERRKKEKMKEWEMKTIDEFYSE